jgi:hypothetical protein
LAHSNYFPEIFQEKTAILITLENKIVFETILDIDANVNVHEFKHMAREIGLFKFKADLISLNYKGLDQSTNFDITVQKSSEKREV